MSKRHGFSPKLIAYVEKSIGKKFKKIPTLHKTSKEHNYNKSKVVVKGNKVVKVKKAEVYLRRHNFSKRDILNGTSMAIHELRENLIMQHDPKITESGVHNRVMKYKNKDINWVKSQLRQKT